MLFLLLFIVPFLHPLYAQPPNYSDLDEIFYHIHADESEEFKKLSEKRAEMLKNREEILKKEKEGTIKIAILGNSALKYTKEGFNDELLRLLLENVALSNVQAVFFLGPLVAPGASLDPLQKLLKEYLGETPVYPTPDNEEIVRKFNLPVSETFPKGYTVLIKDAFFAIFSTDESSESKLIDWLSPILQKHIGRNRFVLANTAAFSTLASEGIYEGMDRRPFFRDQFWNLLRKGDVDAFFGSNEILFDRSYRSGVWQFLTGGAGATRSFDIQDDTFYHFIVLTIPQDRVGPQVEVLDLQGRKRDGLLLNTHAPAITQFRISTSVN